MIYNFAPTYLKMRGDNPHIKPMAKIMEETYIDFVLWINNYTPTYTQAEMIAEASRDFIKEKFKNKSKKKKYTESPSLKKNRRGPLLEFYSYAYKVNDRDKDQIPTPDYNFNRTLIMDFIYALKADLPIRIK